MTRDEQSAIRHLETAKRKVKDAFLILDPAAMDPSAKAILRVIDSIDVAIKKIKERDRI